MDRAALRVYAEGARPVEDEGADIGRFQLVHPQQLETGLVHLLGGLLHRELIGSGRRDQSDHVIVETEYGGSLGCLVGANALEDTSSVLEGM